MPALASTLPLDSPAARLALEPIYVCMVHGVGMCVWECVGTHSVPVSWRALRQVPSFSYLIL